MRESPTGPGACDSMTSDDDEGDGFAGRGRVPSRTVGTMRIVGAMGLAMAATLLGAALVAPPAEGSTDMAAQLSRLTVKPDASWSCPDGVNPCTRLDAGMGLSYTNETTRVTASLMDLASGAHVPIDYDEYPVASDTLTPIPIDTYGMLPTGRYALALTLETSGKWDCSVYDPDVCRWYDGETDHLAWRFVYDGGSTSTFNEYIAPSAEFKKIPGKPLAKKTRDEFVVRGRVVATAETASFGLTNASAHRRVSLYRRPLHGGRWVRVDRTHAHKNGKFRLQGAAPAGKTYRWYVWMPKRGTSPAFLGQTVRA